MPPSKAKKQRLTNGQGDKVVDHETIKDKHLRFLAWARDNEVEVYNAAPQALPGKGLGLVTTKRILSGERILFVPEKTMVKPQSTSLKTLGLEHASSQARLTMTSLMTFAGHEAKKQIWMDTWPTRADFEKCMPLYWHQSLIDCMPRSARNTFQRQASDYNKDWMACKAAAAGIGFDEDSYKYHWMIVNSRSFHWTPPRKQPSYMVLCPFIDYLNHGPTGSGCTVIQRNDGYEVLAQRDYEPGEELLASYGSHSNDKLLVHYGFILPSTSSLPSADDEVRIDEQVLNVLSESVKERLSDVGFLSPYALIPISDDESGNTSWGPCFKTQVAIRATIQTCNEWEFFAENGDDLGPDASDSVDSRLAQALRPLLEEARKRSMTRNGDNAAVKRNTKTELAMSMIDERWKQIEDIVDAYTSKSKG